MDNLSESTLVDPPEIAQDTPSSSTSPSRSQPSPSFHKPDTTSSHSNKYKDRLASAEMLDDGRIDISLRLKKGLTSSLPREHTAKVDEFAVDEHGFESPPRMNIVIMIVGSRGDVQPYVALGQRLLHDGHRVRLATHDDFRDFVRKNGLEFFNIGGNPHELMSYMVRNPGLIPGCKSLRNGDISRKRKMLGNILDGCWRSCHEPDEETGKTFAADAIISNPPTFAHIHCAEALGIPLTMTFTMPWTPTTAFPHPLVNIKHSDAGLGITHYFSYILTDLMTWQGMGDIVDKFRSKTLKIFPLYLRSGPGVLYRLKLPWTYCMSPSLVPKPADWANNIDVVGFYFLDLSIDYEPPSDLVAFLEAGPPPIYIGFGSVVVEDPQAMTATIFQAIHNAEVRALVSAGWGGLGTHSDDVPDNIFIVGNVPHDWLFSRVAAVCHHGGAGTTATGLRLGKPTIVVPFFGDQPFWGRKIYEAGAGPKPIPHRRLAVDNLTEAIQFVLRPEAQSAAQKLGEQIRREDGTTNGVRSFYRHLPLLNMRCDLEPHKLAIWWSSEHCLRLSAFAAQTLHDAGLLDMDKLSIHRSKEYDSARKVTEPLTSGTTAVFWAVTGLYSGLIQLFYQPVQGFITSSMAVPRGVMSLISSVSDGLHNIPLLYGSRMRPPGIVDNLQSGLKEGAKDFLYANVDAVTGLVKETVAGAKGEGFLGILKGTGRGLANVPVLPVAGAMGLVDLPMRGALRSARRKWFRRLESVHRKTREDDGVEAVKQSTPEERLRVIELFHEALTTAKERKGNHRSTSLDETWDKLMLDDAVVAGRSASVSADGSASGAETPMLAQSRDALRSHSSLPDIQTTPDDTSHDAGPSLS